MAALGLKDTYIGSQAQVCSKFKNYREILFLNFSPTEFLSSSAFISFKWHIYYVKTCIIVSVT
jgi:hypothetical protein